MSSNIGRANRGCSRDARRWKYRAGPASGSLARTATRKRLALHAVLGRRAIRNRAVLPLPKRAAGKHERRRPRIFDGDFGPPPEEGLQWPPFRTFGGKFYTYQILLDLKVGEGLAIRTEPHPRFYANSTNTVPIAVPALLRNWWPMMFFIVFKAPPGRRRRTFLDQANPLRRSSCCRKNQILWLKRWARKSVPSGNCRLAGFTKAELRFRPTPTGLRHPRLYSTELTAISCGRRKPKPEGRVGSCLNGRADAPPFGDAFSERRCRSHDGGDGDGGDDGVVAVLR